MAIVQNMAWRCRVSLPVLFVVSGILCIACCLFMHQVGDGNPGRPISIEFANGNPLAILFFVLTPGMAIISAMIHRERLEFTSSFLLVVAAVSLVVLAFTHGSSSLHIASLVVIIGCLFLTMAIGVLREPRFVSVVLLAACYAVLYMFLIGLIIETDQFGLGYVERAWFFLYFANALHNFTTT